MIRNLIGVLLLLVSVGVYAWFFLPKVQEVREVTVQKEVTNQLITAKTTRRDTLKQLVGVFAPQQDRISRYISTLPQEPEIPEVLVSVETMAQQAGLQIQSVVPQVNKSEKEVAVTMIANGQLDAIEKMFELVATNDRPISIKGLTITQYQNSKDLSATLLLRVPFVPTQTD